MDKELSGLVLVFLGWVQRGNEYVKGEDVINYDGVH